MKMLLSSFLICAFLGSVKFVETVHYGDENNALFWLFFLFYWLLFHPVWRVCRQPCSSLHQATASNIENTSVVGSPMLGLSGSSANGAKARHGIAMERLKKKVCMKCASFVTFYFLPGLNLCLFQKIFKAIPQSHSVPYTVTTQLKKHPLNLNQGHLSSLKYLPWYFFHSTRGH